MPKSQIIKDIVEDAVPLAKSLYRLYVLSLDVKNNKLSEWALSELKGYQKTDSIPEYRKTKSANFTYSGINGRFQVSKIHLPIGWIPEELLDRLINIDASEGIDLIENFAREQNGMAIDRSDLAGFVSKATKGDVQCTSINQHIPQSFYAGICAEVKSKMIQALFELERKYGNLDNLGIDISNKKPQELIADNDSLNRMVLNVTVPQQEPPKEKLTSKITWNLLVPVITAVAGAILGAALLAFLGLS